MDDDMRELIAVIKARALETKALLPFEEVAQIVNDRLGGKALVGGPVA